MVEVSSRTLIYDINSNKDGICEKLNLVVATNHNIAGIEKSLKVTAQQIFEQNALDNITLPKPML